MSLPDEPLANTAQNFAALFIMEEKPKFGTGSTLVELS
jgi:hypothetical protein